MNEGQYVNIETGEIKVLELVDYSLAYGRQYARLSPAQDIAKERGNEEANMALFVALAARRAVYLASVANVAEDFRPWVPEEKFGELYSLAAKIAGVTIEDVKDMQRGYIEFFEEKSREKYAESGERR